MTTHGRIYSITGPSLDTADTPTPESEIAQLRRELEEAQRQAIWWKILATKAIKALKQKGVISDGDWIEEYRLAMSGGMLTQQNGETTAQLQGGGGLLQDGHRRAEAGNHREE